MMVNTRPASFFSYRPPHTVTGPRERFALMSAFLNVLAYATIPAAVVVIGGIVGAVRTPGAAARSAVQHFAAGVVLLRWPRSSCQT